LSPDLRLVVGVNRSVVASLVGVALAAYGVWTGPVTTAMADIPVAAATKLVVKLPVAPAGLPSAIESLASYVPAASCDGKDKPGSAALGRFLKGTYPMSSYGISRSCGTNAMSTTEHNEGRAVDWMSSSRVPQQKANAQAVIRWLLAKDSGGRPYANARRLGVMYLIWDNKIWGAYRPGDGWRPYQSCGTAAKAGAALDTSCHRDHIHLSLSWEGAMGRTSFWTKRVAAPDYGPCRVAGLNWAASRRAANPRPCPSMPVVKAEAGSSALHASLVRSSGLTVNRGSSGAVVVSVQKLVGATPDGGFGVLTESKVRAFQKVQQVPATGVVDHPTWRAALKHTAPKAVATKASVATNAVKPAVTANTYARYERVVLRRGSTGSVVKVLQSALRAGVDGQFGPLTEGKVRAYQKSHRLTQNGVVTTSVWRALGKYARYEGVVLRCGSTGSVVRVLQSALRAGVDGQFGPLTEAKVRAFQKSHRLTQSGVVTAPVWRALT